MKEIKCIKCNKTPQQLDEYQPWNTQTKLPAEEYVIREEGTYNKENGHFYCTQCYIDVGMPLGVAP